MVSIMCYISYFFPVNYLWTECKIQERGLNSTDTVSESEPQTCTVKRYRLQIPKNKPQI